MRMINKNLLVLGIWIIKIILLMCTHNKVVQPSPIHVKMPALTVQTSAAMHITPLKNYDAETHSMESSTCQNIKELLFCGHVIQG